MPQLGEGEEADETETAPGQNELFED